MAEGDKQVICRNLRTKHLDLFKHGWCFLRLESDI